MSNWFLRQWNDVKGNAKWEVAKILLQSLFGGSIIASFVALWKALRHGPFEPYLFGAVLLVSAGLFFRVSRHSADQFQVHSPRTPPRSQPSHPVVDLKKPNLRTEIMEVLFSIQRFGLSNDIFILLNLRVVNHGEEEVVVTGWDLSVEVGESTLNGVEDEIPRGWRIRRLPLFGPPTIETINPDASAFLEPLRKGVPKTRWINFKLMNLARILPPHDAKLTVALRDAFGNTHLSVADAGFRADSGEIIST